MRSMSRCGVPDPACSERWMSSGPAYAGGVVRSVSADRLVDPQSSQPNYMARVEVDRSEMEQLGSAISLVAR